MFNSAHKYVEVAARRSQRRLSRIAKGPSQARYSKLAHAGIAKGGGLFSPPLTDLVFRLEKFSEGS